MNILVLLNTLYSNINMSYFLLHSKVWKLNLQNIFFFLQYPTYNKYNVHFQDK